MRQTNQSGDEQNLELNELERATIENFINSNKRSFRRNL
jgi:hypothetical protein